MAYHAVCSSGLTRYGPTKISHRQLFRLSGKRVCFPRRRTVNPPRHFRENLFLASTKPCCSGDGADDRIRTRIASLEGWDVTLTLTSAHLSATLGCPKIKGGTKTAFVPRLLCGNVLVNDLKARQPRQTPVRLASHQGDALGCSPLRRAVGFRYARCTSPHNSPHPWRTPVGRLD